MKNKEKITVLLAIVFSLFALSLTGCDNGSTDEPEIRTFTISATITPNSYSITVKDDRTGSAQINAIVAKLQDMIDEWDLSNQIPSVQTRFNLVFGRGFTIVVETGTYYGEAKFVDNKTVALHIDYVLATSINDISTSLVPKIMGAEYAMLANPVYLAKAPITTKTI